MRRSWIIVAAVALCLSAALAIGVTAARKPASPLADLPSGRVQLMSAGALAFGPDGILFIGDNAAGTVVAIDTQDRTPVASATINVEGIDSKIAALVGVTPDQLIINDMKVNPISKNVYLSVARGQGPSATAMIIRVDPSGNISNVPLDNAKHSMVSLVDAATAAEPQSRENPRMLTITDMVYLNGNLVVAGLSNEEWSSTLRSIPFPFDQTATPGTQVQIWHASHGRYETESPIRTLVPYKISGRQVVIASYTCTPLVEIPVSDLKSGAKVHGSMIADLGGGNQTLDMIPYKKDGHDYILIANTTRGVMKLKADNLESYPVIDSPTVPTAPHHVAGVPYEPLSDLKERAAPATHRWLERAAPGEHGHRRTLCQVCWRPGCRSRVGAAAPADDCVALTHILGRRSTSDRGHPHEDGRSRKYGLALNGRACDSRNLEGAA